MSVSRFLKTNAELHLRLFSRSVVSSSSFSKILRALLVKLCRSEMRRMIWSVVDKKLANRMSE